MGEPTAGAAGDWREGGVHHEGHGEPAKVTHSNSAISI